ncbi:MAG: hypothetical protein DIJKHBIC_02787 [Thermoanaerobaculia bacterium]|nr:hypothetical protein [Thermoanaerobaculia bacterium]
MTTSRPHASLDSSVSSLARMLGASLLITLSGASAAHAAIPASQRTALVDLYNNTAGGSWLTRTNWLNATGTECTWYGVTCDIEQTTVQSLSLPGNRLNGTLPTTLGNLSNLRTLNLSNNQLYGTLPASLSSAYYLETLRLQSNRLGGSIPSSYTVFMYLTTLDIRWNALYTSDPALLTFLNGKQSDWSQTQTIAPTNVLATSPTTTTITITWTPIVYTTDSGYYEVMRSTTPGGPYTSSGTTANKSASSYVVTGLNSGTVYYFVVRTVTTSHANNQNTVYSENSPYVSNSTQCAYTPSPAGASVGAGGATGQTFQVQPGASCYWRAISGASWLTVTAGSPHLGTGNVTYSVAANTGPARTGTITIEDYATRGGGSAPEPGLLASGSFTVTQASGCVYSLNPTSMNIGMSGGTNLIFQVQSGSGCPWTATSNVSWIVVTAGASGTGNGTVTYRVLSNTGVARTGTITAGGQTFTVNQDGTCAYTLNPPSASVGAPGATGLSFQVQTGSNCFWTAASNAAWITITGGVSGTGTGTVNYSVSANPGSARTGTITAGGQTFTVNQSGSCSYSLNPTSASAPASGASGQTFQVQTTSGCNWTAVSNSTFLQITSGASGTGPATVTYSVLANSGGSRSGTITAAGQTFTVNQAGCPAITLNPAVLPAARIGQLFSQVVSASGGVSPYTFSGSGLPPWLSLNPATGALSGTPSQTGSFTFAISAKDANNCPGSREYTLVVNEEPCQPVSVTPATLPAGRAGQVYSTRISASGGTAPYQFLSANLPSWLVLGRSTGELAGTPPSPGTFSFLIEVQDARGCEGERSYQLTIEGCERPATPSFTSVPGDAIPAGTPFTVAWTPVLLRGSGGHYDVEIATGQSCVNPLLLTVREPVITVPTQPGVATTYCVKVMATDASGCQGNATGQEKVTTRLPRPGFAVIGQVPTTAAQRQGSPEESPRVLVRNLGAVPDGLSLSGIAGYFEADPPSLADVPPGADAVFHIRFSPEATSSPGLRSGNLAAIWDEGRLQAPVFLTVLEGEAGGAEGVKLSYVGSNEVHFRKAGEGNPASLEVTIKNTGDRPARVAPRIGPGGAWLSVAGDFSTPLPAGATRVFTLSVDRSKRTASDGEAPLVTNLVFQNVDGRPEDAAYGQVFDEEPPLVESGRNRPALPEESFSLFIGSVVSADGIGARFVSDAWIRNRGATPVQATLYFTPDGKDGLEDPEILKATITIAAFSTYRLSDLVKGIFGLDGLSGQVEIRSAGLPQLSVRSTADAITTKEAGIARYGSEIPIVLSGQGVRLGAGARKRAPAAQSDWMGVLTALRDPAAGFRTNIILAETAGAAASVRLTLYDKDGGFIGQKEVGLSPYSKRQVNASDTELFPEGKAFDGGTAEILPLGGSGAVAAFATVIDNASGSYATRRAEVFQVSAAARGTRTIVPRAASGPTFLPAVTRSEALNNSFYSTRLALTNLARTEARVQLTYQPDRGQGELVRREVVVPARSEGPRALVWEDVLGNLFEIDTNSSGMVRFDSVTGALSIASETSTPIDLTDPGKGRSISAVNPGPGKPDGEPLGVFSLDSEEVIGTPQSGSSRSVVTHPAIDEGFAFRTNLILAELTGQPVEVKVRVVKAGTDGVSLGEKTYALDPYQRLQRNKVVREVAGVGSDDPSAEFKDIELQIEAVGGTGRALAIVTKIDNNPASKRADIFTLGGAIGGSPLGFGN